MTVPNPAYVARPLADLIDYGTAQRLALFCPGCKRVHQVGITGPQPLWDWNGDLVNVTLSPSILAHGSVHLCPEHPDEVCPDPDGCGRSAHRVLPDGQRGHATGHLVEPAWGNCHSFVRNGRWEFLADCAHDLAGQTVPLVPLPEWWFGIHDRP